MFYYILAALLLLFIYLAAVVFPKRHNPNTKYLEVAVKGLIDEYFIAHTEKDLEKKRLRLHKLTISADRVLSQILWNYGLKDSSVKQQLRSALERNTLTYDQFRVLKQFHHMRNEVVHEGLQVYGDNEQIVYAALVVMKKFIA
jgi:hypothetical protein